MYTRDVSSRSLLENRCCRFNSSLSLPSPGATHEPTSSSSRDWLRGLVHFQVDGRRDFCRCVRGRKSREDAFLGLADSSFLSLLLQRGASSLSSPSVPVDAARLHTCGPLFHQNSAEHTSFLLLFLLCFFCSVSLLLFLLLSFTRTSFNRETAVLHTRNTSSTCTSCIHMSSVCTPEC